jgi:hypothetical protein
MKRIRNEHIKEIMGVKGKLGIIEEKGLPCQKDAREEYQNKLCNGYQRGEEKEDVQQNLWMEAVQSAMTARHLEQDQRRNKEEWHLASRRW